MKKNLKILVSSTLVALTFSISQNIYGSECAYTYRNQDDPWGSYTALRQPLAALNSILQGNEFTSADDLRPALGTIVDTYQELSQVCTNHPVFNKTTYAEVVGWRDEISNILNSQWNYLTPLEREYIQSPSCVGDLVQTKYTIRGNRNIEFYIGNLAHVVRDGIRTQYQCYSPTGVSPLIKEGNICRKSN